MACRHRRHDLQVTQGVGESVIAILGVAAIFGQLVIVAIAVAICAPFVHLLCGRLAPGIVVAVALRCGGSEVATIPQQAARQTEVHPFNGGIAAIVPSRTVVVLVAGNRSHAQHSSNGYQKNSCLFHC